MFAIGMTGLPLRSWWRWPSCFSLCCSKPLFAHYDLAAAAFLCGDEFSARRAIAAHVRVLIQAEVRGPRAARIGWHMLSDAEIALSGDGRVAPCQLPATRWRKRGARAQTLDYGRGRSFQIGSNTPPQTNGNAEEGRILTPR